MFWLEPGTVTRNALGILQYIALEPVNGEGCDHKPDVWALRITMFSWLPGLWPYYSNDEEDIKEEMQAGLPGRTNDPIMREISEDGFQMLVAKLKVDTAERIGVKEAMQHRWLASFAKEESVFKSINNCDLKWSSVCCNLQMLEK
jgi:serine/threonine protein kinase